MTMFAQYDNRKNKLHNDSFFDEILGQRYQLTLCPSWVFFAPTNSVLRVWWSRLSPLNQAWKRDIGQG